MTFKKLRFSTIVGIVDSYGAVHSIAVGLDDDKSLLFHEHTWPCHNRLRWRWDFNESIHDSVLGEKLTEEEFDKIERHITKKYGIRFFENGATDWEHFQKRLDKEKK